jgi:hypothetical protein
MRTQLTRSITLFEPPRSQPLAKAGSPVPPCRQNTGSDAHRGSARQLLGLALLGACALFAPVLRCLH